VNSDRNSPKARDRHGRDRYRAPLVGERTARNSGFTEFEQVVAVTCDWLRAQHPVELAQLSWRVADAPTLEDADIEVPRFSVDEATQTITIYRVPVIRLTHNRRTDFLDERHHIEQFVFMAAAKLLGREPWDNDHDH
jgi:hypothetical protein